MHSIDSVPNSLPPTLKNITEKVPLIHEINEKIKSPIVKNIIKKVQSIHEINKEINKEINNLIAKDKHTTAYSSTETLQKILNRHVERKNRHPNDTLLQKRLDHRINLIKELISISSNNKYDILTIGFDEDCTIRTESHKGISQLDTVVLKEKNKENYEIIRLAGSYSLQKCGFLDAALQKGEKHDFKSNIIEYITDGDIANKKTKWFDEDFNHFDEACLFTQLNSDKPPIEALLDIYQNSSLIKWPPDGYDELVQLFKPHAPTPEIANTFAFLVFFMASNFLTTYGILDPDTGMSEKLGFTAMSVGCIFGGIRYSSEISQTYAMSPNDSLVTTALNTTCDLGLNSCLGLGAAITMFLSFSDLIEKFKEGNLASADSIPPVMSLVGSTLLTYTNTTAIAATSYGGENLLLAAAEEAAVGGVIEGGLNMATMGIGAGLVVLSLIITQVLKDKDPDLDNYIGQTLLINLLRYSCKKHDLKKVLDKKEHMYTKGSMSCFNNHIWEELGIDQENIYTENSENKNELIDHLILKYRSRDEFIAAVTKIKTKKGSQIFKIKDDNTLVWNSQLPKGSWSGSNNWCYKTKNLLQEVLDKYDPNLDKAVAQQQFIQNILSKKGALLANDCINALDYIDKNQPGCPTVFNVHDSINPIKPFKSGCKRVKTLFETFRDGIVKAKQTVISTKNNLDCSTKSVSNVAKLIVMGLFSPIPVALGVAVLVYESVLVPVRTIVSPILQIPLLLLTIPMKSAYNYYQHRKLNSLCNTWRTEMKFFDHIDNDPTNVVNALDDIGVLELVFDLLENETSPNPLKKHKDILGLENINKNTLVNLLNDSKKTYIGGYFHCTKKEYTVKHILSHPVIITAIKKYYKIYSSETIPLVHLEEKKEREKDLAKYILKNRTTQDAKITISEKPISKSLDNNHLCVAMGGASASDKSKRKMNRLYDTNFSRENIELMVVLYKNEYSINHEGNLVDKSGNHVTQLDFISSLKKSGIKTKKITSNEELKSMLSKCKPEKSYLALGRDATKTIRVLKTLKSIINPENSDPENSKDLKHYRAVMGFFLNCVIEEFKCRHPYGFQRTMMMGHKNTITEFQKIIEAIYDGKDSLYYEIEDIDHPENSFFEQFLTQKFKRNIYGIENFKDHPVFGQKSLVTIEGKNYLKISSMMQFMHYYATVANWETQNGPLVIQGGGPNSVFGKAIADACQIPEETVPNHTVIVRTGHCYKGDNKTGSTEQPTIGLQNVAAMVGLDKYQSAYEENQNGVINNFFGKMVTTCADMNPKTSTLLENKPITKLDFIGNGRAAGDMAQRVVLNGSGAIKNATVTIYPNSSLFSKKGHLKESTIDCLNELKLKDVPFNPPQDLIKWAEKTLNLKSTEKY
ncbi:MAG: hypothetical protein ACON5K_02015 [Bacteroidia bacterium]